MAAKIKIISTNNGIHTLQFLCPACKFKSGNPMPHNIQWQKDNLNTWQFDENYENPSITPSIAITGYQIIDGIKINDVCHTWITKGKVKFFDNCTHELKGEKWVELPEII